MNAPVAEGAVIDNKYRVERVLGKGGMGMVVAASHLLLPQRVAIKFLLIDGNPALKARFHREAIAAAQLRGEHVVRVLDVSKPDADVPYIVMEYLEGQDLDAVLRARETLGLQEALDHVLQACEGMAEAHAAGFVHRDLKPANLFLTTKPDGARLVKVLDFGISKKLPGGSEGQGASLTQTQEMLGTPLYMSPEQMQSSRSVDARADIWAMGAILYRMLTGKPPFEAATLIELSWRVRDDAPKPPRALRRDIPPELEAVILRCLEKDPARRPATVAVLARALAPFASANGQECAERTARILKGAPSRGSQPSTAHLPEGVTEAAAPLAATPSAAAPLAATPLAAAPLDESALPTTQVMVRSPAPPAPRKTSRVVVGTAVLLAFPLALLFSRSVPLRGAGSAPQADAAIAPEEARPSIAESEEITSAPPPGSSAASPASTPGAQSSEIASAAPPGSTSSSVPLVRRPAAPPAVATITTIKAGSPSRKEQLPPRAPASTAAPVGSASAPLGPPPSPVVEQAPPAERPVFRDPEPI